MPGRIWISGLMGAAVALAVGFVCPALAQDKPADAGATTTQPPVAAAPATPAPDTPAATPDTADDPTTNPDTGDEGPSLEEEPQIETMELTPDIAKRALDAYVVVHEKYKDADIENYDNLQDFVDKTPEGKNFEADIKAAGFANVSDWNLAITTETFVYANIVEDLTADIKQEIEDLKNDTELAQDMKDRMIASRQAMIPSDNNRKIVEDLMKDPAYAEKFKTLDIVEE